jgi:hypothetical protein
MWYMQVLCNDKISLWNNKDITIQDTSVYIENKILFQVVFVEEQSTKEKREKL